jgi:DNA-binding transcriptional LysR family regulator
MQQIRYFLAVAEELNFTTAAERCNVSQPALSRAIMALEQELGGALFHRERRFTHLTELGRLVQPYLADVYETSRRAQQTAIAFAKSEKHRLRLGIMSTIAPSEFIELIKQVRAAHPRTEMQLCDSDSQSLRSKLLAGDLELTVYAMPGGEPDDRTHCLPLFREQMMIVVHPGHRLANQSAIRVKDIDGENYIHRNNCEFAGYADKILAQQGVTVNPAYWSDRDDWTLAMVAAGLGFGFLPAHCSQHQGVVALPVVEPEFWREVSLVSVRGRRHTPAVGALVREAMRKLWFGERALGLEPAAAG